MAGTLVAPSEKQASGMRGHNLVAADYIRFG